MALYTWLWLTTHMIRLSSSQCQAIQSTNLAKLSKIGVKTHQTKMSWICSILPHKFISIGITILISATKSLTLQEPAHSQQVDGMFWLAISSLCLKETARQPPQFLWWRMMFSTKLHTLKNAKVNIIWHQTMTGPCKLSEESTIMLVNTDNILISFSQTAILIHG